MRGVLTVAFGLLFLFATSAQAVEANGPRETRVACGAGESLQQAIDAAKPGDRLVVSGTCQGHFEIRTSIDLVGANPRATLRGTASALAPIVFIGQSATVKIRNLRLTGNTSEDVDGSAIDNRGRLIAADTSIVGNRAGSCGAARNTGRLEFRRSQISDNRASHRTGGVCNEGNLILRRTTMSDNSAERDGHISSTGTLTIARSVLQKGLAGNAGHSAISSSGSLLIRNSRIVGNQSVGGGAIEHTGAARIERTTVRGNHGFVGAILTDGPTWILDSVIQDNRAEEGAAGIVARDLTLRRSVVKGNRTAFFDGGGISVSGDSVIGKTRIGLNRTPAAGGGVLNRGNLRVHGSRIFHNRALTGGGILNDGGSVRVQGTVYIGNQPGDCSGC